MNLLRYKVFAVVVLIPIAISLGCRQNERVLEYKKYQSDADVPRISVEEAKREVDAGSAAIIDSRADFAYKLEHIAGALNVPVGSSEEEFKSLPKGKKLIVYCS